MSGKLQKFFCAPMQFFASANTALLWKAALASFFLSSLEIGFIAYGFLGGGAKDTPPHFFSVAWRQTLWIGLMLLVYCLVASILCWGLSKLIKRPAALLKVLSVYGITLCVMALMSLAMIPAWKSNEGCGAVFVVGCLTYGWVTGSGLAAIGGGTARQAIFLAIPHVLVSFAIFMLTYLPAYAERPPAKPPAEIIGKMSPDITVQLAQGGSFTVSKNRGKVLMLDFWATWCPACCQGLPHIQELADRYHAQGLDTYAFSCESKDTVMHYAQEHKLHLPLALSQPAIHEAFHVGAIPLTVLIDKDGKISALYLGAREPDKLEQNIKTLLAQPYHQ